MTKSLASRSDGFFRVCALALTCMTATYCAAQTSDNPIEQNTEGSVALNQGASLDLGPEAAPKGVDSHPVDSASINQTKAASDETSSRSMAEGGGIPRRRTVRRASVTAATIPPVEPWYRSGLGALAIVLLLIGGAAWAVRRWAPAARDPGSKVLQVVARASLTPKQSVALIRLGRRFVLVGLAGDGTRALCEVTDPDEVAELVARVDGNVARSSDKFERLLVEESAEYDPKDSSAPETSNTGTPARAVSRIREPLEDLLRRLRTLQSK